MRFSVLIEFFSVLRFYKIFSTVLRFLIGLNTPSLINMSKFFKDNKVAFEKLASAYHTKLQEDPVLTF